MAILAPDTTMLVRSLSTLSSRMTSGRAAGKGLHRLCSRIAVGLDCADVTLVSGGYNVTTGRVTEIMVKIDRF